jgi:predicted LPLAT superfamily acyltransferase
MSFRPCAIVPSRNHHTAIAEVVDRLRAAGLPVLVIDDGSDEPARSVLAALGHRDGVSVHRLEPNRGKGGAVVAGFEHADAAGFTHALQVDADGQHDLSAVPRVLDAGARDPRALILGVPQFDRSMPLGRRVGRYITHFWVAVETLTPRLVDAMCGFRLYPLAATLAVVRHEWVGRRMEFDATILVKLNWRGMGFVAVPVGVTYPAGNTSNFRLAADNWRISVAHARLVLTMLVRLPQILRHRPPRLKAPSHWAGMAERGAYWGLCIMAAVYRLTGRYGCLAVAMPIACIFHVTGPEQRRAARLFRQRANVARGSGRSSAPFDGLRHVFSFARELVELFAAWMSGPGARAMDSPNQAAIDRLLAERRGILVVVSHLGNTQLSRALLQDDVRRRITVLVHTRHAENFQRILRRFRPDAAANTHQVTELSPATIIDLKERIDGGDWVVIAGDRTPVGGGGRVSSAPFLGHPAPFPHGPYMLAHLLDCPVYLLFCLRHGSGYRLHFEPLAERLVLPRRDREAALAQWAARYATRLEAHAMDHPFQWYNFFDFWAGCPELSKAQGQ